MFVSINEYEFKLVVLIERLYRKFLGIVHDVLLGTVAVECMV